MSTAEVQDLCETGARLDERLEVRAGRHFPYATVGDYVALAEDLPDKSKLAYWFLRMHVNHTRDDDEVWPTLDTIASFLNLSSKSRKKREEAVAGYLRPLIEMGAVDKRLVRYGPRRMYSRNVYVPHEAPAHTHSGPESLAVWYRERRKLTPTSDTPAGPADSQETRRSVRTPPCRGGSGPPPTGGGKPSLKKENNSVRPSVTRAHTREYTHKTQEGKDTTQAITVVEQPVPTQRTDGRTDGSPHPRNTHHEDPEARPIPAAVLPAEETGQLSSTVDALLGEQAVTEALRRLDCRSSQRVQLTELVAAVLAQGHHLDRVRGYVLAKARESTSRRMSYLLGAFTPDHVGDLADAQPIPHRAPRPHPDAATSRATNPAHHQNTHKTPQQDRQPLNTPSPVPWVTDAQYATLKPSERSLLATHAHQDETTLTHFVRSVFGRIRHQLTTTTTTSPMTTPNPAA